jgi:hypothetical protein
MKVQDMFDSGHPVEMGFKKLKEVYITDDAPDFQVRDMRVAFFAGAQFLYHTMMSMLDPDEEPTEGDMVRMKVIHDELEAFTEEFD